MKKRERYFLLHSPRSAVTHVSLREEADCIYRTDGSLSTGYLVLEALLREATARLDRRDEAG